MRESRAGKNKELYLKEGMMVTKERYASRNDINNADRGRASQAKGTTAQSPK